VLSDEEERKLSKSEVGKRARDTKLTHFTLTASTLSPAFMKSQTWYRPHESATHTVRGPVAFPKAVDCLPDLLGFPGDAGFDYSTAGGWEQSVPVHALW